MKSTITLVILSLFLQASWSKIPYSLTIYEDIGCHHCKYIVSQLGEIMKMPTMSNKVQLIIKDCKVQKSACRDTLHNPLIILRRQDDSQQLGEVGGIRSFKFLQTWILALIKKDISNEKYQYQQIKGYSTQKLANPDKFLQGYQQRRDINPIEGRLPSQIHNQSQKKGKSTKLFYGLLISVIIMLISCGYAFLQHKRRNAPYPFIPVDDHQIISLK